VVVDDWLVAFYIMFLGCKVHENKYKEVYLPAIALLFLVPCQRRILQRLRCVTISPDLCCPTFQALANLAIRLVLNQIFDTTARSYRRRRDYG
jgi:hypothetical protein